MALFTAALNNDVAGVRGAIANGAKVDFFFRPEDSKNALHVAAQHGYIAVLEELLGAGAHVNAVAVSSQDTALTLAAQNGWLQAVELLLRSGAEVNAGGLSVILAYICLAYLTSEYLRSKWLWKYSIT